jgi:hypothetical protein
MWHVFVAPFPMDASESLVRVGTTTDPLKRLHALQADFPFPLTAPCYAPIAPSKQPAALLDALLTDASRPYRARGHWLRCPREWALGLPALIDELAAEVTGSAQRLAWQRPARSLIEAFGLGQAARRALLAERTGAQRRITPVGAEPARSGCAPIQQCYALLRDGRALSLQALLRLIAGPVNKTSLASQLSRNPDFRHLEGLGWVLASAQDAEQRRRTRALDTVSAPCGQHAPA